MDTEKSNTSKIIGVVVAILLLIIVIAAVAMNGNDDKDDDKKDKKDDSSMMGDEEQTVEVGGAAMFPSKNIIENVSQASNLTTVVAAIQAADLVETLSGPGPFTVFGPNNAAFEALPAGTVDSLLLPENKAQLQDILTYHVVAGEYTTDDLEDGQKLATVQGEMLTITKAGTRTLVNGVSIETPDVLQSNGVAHVITGVLLPPAEVSVGGAAMSRSKNVVENASLAPNLSTVVTAVQAADLVETLSGPGPFTVFAPDNDAFAALPEGTVATLLQPANKAELQKVLTYHVVADKILASELTDGQELTTVQGQILTVSVTNGVVSLTSDTGNTAVVSQADVIQSNGVAHIIDSVLLPE